ncbi:universal stress protein [Cupriavidus sp. WKF15]|uniref:universal stress protein n=1 Tax=Cupriavidus sp. WKF15 TaxID=3032282 RepID=UPI0023E1FC48|nr:universal stress protein [Cupriavidus sp. WKF15]WER49857.1 universal stress protein [Cupriavidus sp. WKF15]
MIKILVPVDGSECALAAVRHAAFLFREGSISEVVLLNVQAPLERSRASAFHSFAELREYECRQGESALSRACEILEDSGVRYSAIIGLGNAARTIASAAASTQCDSIVMGASLWSQIKACIGGGLPAKVMRRTSVPVTVVKSSRAAGTIDLPRPAASPRQHPRPQLVVYPAAY